MRYLDFISTAIFLVLDYLRLLNLNSYKNLRERYFNIKSRSSFKILLKNQTVYLNPHKNYKKIDV